MQRLPTVLLEHTSRTGRHFDWLLADPRDPGGRLWTVRVGQPGWYWPDMGRWPLERIADHRRIYLTYQGVLSEQRGWVRQVDRGWFAPELWTTRRIVLDLHLRALVGRVELLAVTAQLWQARLLDDAATPEPSSSLRAETARQTVWP